MKKLCALVLLLAGSIGHSAEVIRFTFCDTNGRPYSAYSTLTKSNVLSVTRLATNRVKVVTKGSTSIYENSGPILWRKE